MLDYIPKYKMFNHQKSVFLESRNREYFALLMEMGTGKTKVTIDTACWLYSQGKIDAVLVICPNGLNPMWIDQCKEHIPDYIQYKAAYYRSNMTKQEERDLCQVLESDVEMKVASMNIEAIVTQKGVNFAKNFLISYRTLLVVDESSVIKNPKAQRTKNLLKLSVHAKYRRILTGTPVTQGPLDLFTQFSFLDAHILHTSSYYAFRNRYAVMKEIRTAGRSFQTVVGYQNIEELQKLISPHSYLVKKSECLDLPEKLYTKRYVTLSESQQKLYNSLKKDIVVELNGMVMSAPLALTKILRLQQIVGGFFVPDEEAWMCDELYEMNDITDYKPKPIDKVNPRVESLIDLLGETGDKAIIWARFRSEIDAISKRIREEFGDKAVVEYHGGIEPSKRNDNVTNFQNDPEVRYFIGHVQAGGKGLTLHAASTVVYFSNNFSLEDRLQSEDRAHRIGQTKNVTYIDIIAQNTIDEKIVKALRDKKEIADVITEAGSVADWI